MIEEATRIANLYELYPQTIRDDLETLGYGYFEILALLNYLDRALIDIKEIEDDITYNRQVETTFSIVKKNYEMIIKKTFIDEVMDITEEQIEEYPNKIREHLIEASIIAYKFEVKYYIKILDEILSADIWDDIEIGKF